MKKRNGIILILFFVLAGVFVLALFPRNKVLDTNRVLYSPQISYAHFSVDDCNGIFEDLTTNEYDSLFHQPILSFLESLHDKYGIVVTLYVFFDWDLEKDGFDITQATDRYKDEFSQNANWLKVGFHAADAKAYEDMIPLEVQYYYTKTIQELLRITGSEQCIDRFVRLDRYVASEETIAMLRETEFGVTGLFIADRKDAETRPSYALTEDQRKECYSSDWYVDKYGVSYTPTDIRAEAIVSDEMLYQLLNTMYDQKNLIVFTHEWAIQEENTQQYLDLLAQYVCEYRIASVFCDG